MDRGRRGREIAGQMIALAVLLDVMVLFLWVAMPGYGGGFGPVDPWPSMAPLVAGLLMHAFGLVWMVRIYRADAEPVQDTWRYRRIGAVMPLRPWTTWLPWERARRGRAIARAMIRAVFVAFLISVCLFVVRPAVVYGFQPLLVELVGIAGAVVGLAWMVRIYRADPEPAKHTWRYRAY